jgi:predicted DsbA family dithiol-disulfide isomerase
MTQTEERASDLLTIDVVSDVVCPWCYIGKRRLEAALAERPPTAKVTEIRWHPFQLNPDIPVEGVDRRRYLEDKFGGPERAREIYARVEAAGREVGIAFDFDAIERQPNTVDAHRLLAWVQAASPQHADALVERVFKAYFTEGVNIGRIEELVRLARESGCDEAGARAHLTGDAGRDAVAAADDRMKALGIGGVPFFIFNGRIGVSGAQSPDVLADAVAQAEALRPLAP